MRRIYFISPDLTTAHSVITELSKHRITKEQIHVVGQDNVVQTQNNLQEALLSDVSDILPAMERGAILGAIMGILVGIIIMLLEMDTIAIGFWGILVFGALGLVICAWSSSMIGVSVPSDALKKFNKEITHGKYLLMVDVQKDKMKSLSKIIQNQYPKVACYRLHHTTWFLKAVISRYVFNNRKGNGKIKIK
jgi:uncharacterized membrane protein